MSTYSFPSELADTVLEKWHTYISRGDLKPPSLPQLSELRRILEVVFLAGLEREENRPLGFTICCSYSDRIVREHSDEMVALIPFESDRPMTVKELRSLAPAIDRNTAAILVQLPSSFDANTESRIAGIVHIGSDLARARDGKSFYYRPPPYTLTIEARRPGEIRVYQGSYQIAALVGGEIQEPSIVSAFDFAAVSAILRKGEQALGSRIVPPEREPPREWVEFQWTALLNTILCIVNAIRSREHGGTLLLLEPSAVSDAPFKSKYATNYDVNFLDDRFVEFINLRHKLGDATFQVEENADAEAMIPAVVDLERRVLLAEHALTDAAETIAACGLIDGALVLTSALRMKGFGAEILLERAPQVPVYEVRGNPLIDKERHQFDSESYGMRHRSAARFVGAIHGAVAFVISHDGLVSFCWRDEDRVLMKRGVNTANPNMAGA